MITRIRDFLKEHLEMLRKEGTFGRNLAITVAGNSSAYLIGLLLSPIIARIYLPEAYGQFALLNAFVASLGVFTTFNFINAFVLPKSNKEFLTLVQLALIATVLFTVLTTLILVRWGHVILNIFNAEQLGGLIYFVPVFIFFTGLNRCMEYWNVREKEFKTGAGAKMVSVIGAKIITIVYGLLSKGNVFGFIIADLASKPINSYILFSKSIRQNIHDLRFLSFARLKVVAKIYRNYPVYNMPANGLIVLATQLPVYLLSWYYGSSYTGHFSLAYSLVSIPTQVLGSAVAYVFFQKAAEVVHSGSVDLKRISLPLYKNLIYVGVIPFSLLVVFGDQIFMLVFGDQWETAGIFAGYLGFMAFTSFISLPIASLFRVIRQERLHFYIVLGGACILTIGLLLAQQAGDSHYLVMVYSGISALMHIMLIAVSFAKIGVKPLKLVIRLVGSIIIGFVLTYFIRTLVW